MYWCLQLIYTWRDCNEWKTEKYHERTNMGKVTQPKLWWQLYVTSLSERNIQNFGPLDLCWTECMSAWEKNLSYKYTHTHTHIKSVTQSSAITYTNTQKYGAWRECVIQIETTGQLIVHFALRAVSLIFQCHCIHTPSHTTIWSGNDTLLILNLDSGHRWMITIPTPATLSTVPKEQKVGWGQNRY